MNPYELADELDNMQTIASMTTLRKIANMLRQQADRIAELEKDLEGCEYFLNQEKQSEPVAWLWINNGTTYNALLRNPMCDEKSNEHWSKKGWTSKPLYITPQTKPLSEPFDGGTHVCPSCGCKSLYKTDKSEWCVTHKCLWQSDYETKPLSDEEILEIASPMFVDVRYPSTAIELARAIEAKVRGQ